MHYEKDALGFITYDVPYEKTSVSVRDNLRVDLSDNKEENG